MYAQTLAPYEIIEAIKKGNVTDVDTYGNTKPEQCEFTFCINGERYHLENGHIHVSYNFELPEEAIKMLQLKHLQATKAQADFTSARASVKIAELEAELKGK